MTGTIEVPDTSTAEQDGRLSEQNRRLKIALAVVAVIALVLGGILLYGAVTDDDATSAVPEEVQSLLDDFTTAMETNDYAAMQELVTSDFRRPEFLIESDGTGENRRVLDIEDFDFLDWNDAPEFEIGVVGTPIVRGEGPWIVTVPQDWEEPDTHTKYETTYTFAIAERDGTLLIEDAYSAGIGPILVKD